MDSAELLELTRLRTFLRTGAGRELRLRAGLSLREVAEAVGTSNVTVLKWERGDQVPRGPAAIAYWRLLQRLRRRAAARVS